VCAAAGVAVVFATVVRLTDSLWSGAVAAASLGFAHAFWLHAVITEVYSLNALCLALALAFALEWERGGRGSGSSEPSVRSRSGSRTTSCSARSCPRCSS
jgi:hypothetical protein